MHLKKKVSTLASIFIVGLAFNVVCSSNGKSGSNVEASSDEVMENKCKKSYSYGCRQR